MSKRKLVIAQHINQKLYQKVADLIPEWDIIVGKDKDIWQEHVKDAEIIAGWNKDIENTCLSTETKLKWVQSWSAGVDNYPLDKFAKRNIFLTSATGVHAYPISETIFALMLALTRKIHTYAQNQLHKKWHHEQLNLELHNKTVAIIGVGAIGKETAKIANAFGMHVIGVRNSLKPEPYVDQMVESKQLDSILPVCDYVVVTVPLTKKTYQLFGQEQFNKMKNTSFFINIGRGEVVDEDALIQALTKQQIAGAGLDVFEQEPLATDSPLWDLKNVIVTPHTAGSTEHYDERVIDDIFLPNLKNYLANHTPSVNVVDYNRGY